VNAAGRVILAGVIAASALVVAPSAAASEGSVPAEVSAYATDPDGLVSRLEEFVGVGADGKGIDFDETTETGQVNRAFVFTADWLAGTATDTPVELANQWTVPVSIHEKPVGLAIIWINPDTVRPELSEFIQEIDLAAALADVPAETYLVRDESHEAWFTLVGTTLTPVAAEGSAISLARYQDELAGTPVEEPEEGLNLGTVLSVGMIALVAVVVVAILLIPMLRRRRREAE